jgi:hypothetical protein
VVVDVGREVVDVDVLGAAWHGDALHEVWNWIGLKLRRGIVLGGRNIQGVENFRDAKI